MNCSYAAFLARHATPTFFLMVEYRPSDPADLTLPLNWRLIAFIAIWRLIPYRRNSPLSEPPS